jgi:Flp pilus assembly protein TadD
MPEERAIQDQDLLSFFTPDNQMTEQRTVKLFYSYSHKDEALRDELATHLTLLQRQNVIDTWHDRKIGGGAEWQQAIDDNLDAADIILLLVSADFLASDYCFDVEIQRAMQKHHEKSAVVIPVSLRPCDSNGAAFMKLQGLPNNFKPVIKWEHQDDAFTDIAKGIRAVADRIREQKTANSSHTTGTIPANIFTVPPFPDENFIGRETELAWLDELLSSHSKVALTGRGGVGKTRMALHYAHTQRQKYPFIFWIAAASKASFEDSLGQLADKLNADPMLKQAEKIAFVKAWLEGHRDWLMIFDNADDMQEITAPLLQGVLPVALQGKILFTTQINTANFTSYTLKVECLNDVDGAEFLIKRIAVDKQATAEEMGAAKAISKTLGGLPLALAQAAAYIAETQCSLSAYLPLYQQCAKALLDPNEQEHHQLIADHIPVFATFKLSFSHLPDDAKTLLSFCSLLAADAIPVELLRTAFAVDDFELNERLKPLLRYSLMVRNSGDDTLALHRLVQKVLQLDTNDKQKQAQVELAILALNAILPKGDVEFKDWQLYERLLFSALACAQSLTDLKITSAEAGLLLTRIANYLYEAKADYQLAEPLCQRSLAILEATLGKDHPHVGTSLNNLAELYRLQGRYAEAEPLQLRDLAISEAALGKGHPNVATSLNNLALLYKIQGKYVEAEPLYQRSLAILEDALGKDHSLIAGSLNNLASLYKMQGKYAEAEPLYQRSLAIAETTLGKDHPHVATSLSNLAMLYKTQGKFAEAEPLYLRKR